VCGLFGWQWTNPPDKGDRLVLGAMLASLNDERGGDSWGFAADGGEVIHKGVGYFSRSKAVKDLARYDSLIGHCRFKTSGDATPENAHPFKMGHIVGAHNGCIYNKFALDKEYNRVFAVDSMHVFKHIEEKRWPLDDLEGYGTIEFFDKTEPDSIFLSRFRGELAVARVVGHGLVWSSTKNHLEAALTMAGMDGTYISLTDTVVYKLHKGVIHRTKLRANVARNTTRSYFTNTTNSNYNNRQGRDWENYDGDDYPTSCGPSNRLPATLGGHTLTAREWEDMLNPIGWRGASIRAMKLYKKPFADQRALWNAQQKEKENLTAPSETDTKVTGAEDSALQIVSQRNARTTYVLRRQVSNSNQERNICNEEADEILAVLVQNEEVANAVEDSQTFSMQNCEMGICEYAECKYADKPGATVICSMCSACALCCGNNETSKLFHNENTDKVEIVCTGCTAPTNLPLCGKCGECTDCCHCDRVFNRFDPNCLY
jgi:predicted glutamine amidotransferase